MSALPPKADMCSAARDVRFGPKADIGPTCNEPSPRSDEHSGARQNNPDLGELTRLCIDFDGARMLLNNDVVADGEAKAGAFSRRLSCEERLEHLFFHLRRHTGAVVADSDFHTISEVFGPGRKSRLVVTTVGLCTAPGRSIQSD